MFPLGPLLAALVGLSAGAGKSGVMGFLRKIGQCRIGPGGYALVLLLQPLIVLTAIALTVLVLGVPAPSVPVPELGDLASTALFFFLMVGIGEEPAWRGFALPRLMRRHSTLIAALLVGAVSPSLASPLMGLEYDLQNGAPKLSRP